MTTLWWWTTRGRTHCQRMCNATHAQHRSTRKRWRLRSASTPSKCRNSWRRFSGCKARQVKKKFSASSNTTCCVWTNPPTNPTSQPTDRPTNQPTNQQTNKQISVLASGHVSSLRRRRRRRRGTQHVLAHTHAHTHAHSSKSRSVVTAGVARAKNQSVACSRTEATRLFSRHRRRRRRRRWCW